jgi:hypothetical protein
MMINQRNDMKEICFCYGEHENPYGCHESYDSIGTPKNFITISWFGKDEKDDSHQECWRMEG